MYVGPLHAIFNVVWHQKIAFYNVLLNSFNIDKKTMYVIFNFWEKCDNQLINLCETIKKKIKDKKKTSKVRSNITGNILKVVVNNLEPVKSQIILQK